MEPLALPDRRRKRVGGGRRGGGVAMHWRMLCVLIMLSLVWIWPSPAMSQAVDGDVQLEWTTCESDGTIQIYHSGTWGNICYDGFNEMAATVTCQQIGYENGALMLIRGTADDHVWLSGVTCFGKQKELKDCLLPGTLWDRTVDCQKYEMAGVHCYNDEAEIDCAGNPQEVEGGLKLKKGACETEGPLLVYSQHRWGAVCADSFSDIDAAVACRQMGFEAGWSRDVTSTQWEATNVWLNDVHCHGNETRLTDCQHSQGTCEDQFGHLAGVTCSRSQVRKSCDGNIIINKDKDIRLAEGITNSEGRLEVFYHGHWGAVCKTGNEDFPGQWVCSTLGYSHWEELYTVKHYAPDAVRLTYANCQIGVVGCHPTVMPSLKPCPPIGVRCLNFQDHCRLNPCENGGICTNSDTGAQCACLPGYQGDICHLVSGSSVLLPKWAAGCLAVVGVLGVVFIIIGSLCYWRSRRAKHPHTRLQEEKEETFLAYHDDDENL